MFTEVDPGPFELRLDDNGSDERVGYAWYEGNSGTQNAYFMLKSGVGFPFDYGPDVIFSPHAMEGVTNAEEFYNWVEQNGELGEDISTWAVEESYQPWKQ